MPFAVCVAVSNVAHSSEGAEGDIANNVPSTVVASAAQLADTLPDADQLISPPPPSRVLDPLFSHAQHIVAHRQWRYNQLC